MNKSVPIIICIIFILGSISAAGINQEIENDKSTKTMNVSFNQNQLKLNDKNEFIQLTFKKEGQYLMSPGEPMIPRIVETYELPFGVTDIEIDVKPGIITEQQIQKHIMPSPAPIPLSPQYEYNTPQRINYQIYQSKELYPSAWYKYNIGSGINENFEHVTFVTIHIYPIRYIPADKTLYKTESAEITINYTPSKENPFPTNTAYELAIISPIKFENTLQPFITHKIDNGISTILKTTEDIYNEYQGVDEPEQIKYFIKDALEQWNIKYVLLVGGLKSMIYAKPKDDRNKGVSGWLVPVRYSNMICSGDIGYPTDLYYADVYKEGGEFDDWDSDGDGIFAEWSFQNSPPDDVADLFPDVAIGRFACHNERGLHDVINKVINYETTTHGSDWFKRMTVYSGDGFLDQFDLNIQWDTNLQPDGNYIIKAQSSNPEGDIGPIDEIQVTIDKSVSSEVTFNHDDHLNPALENGYPALPIAEIVSVSNGNILGNTDVTYQPGGGEAYCNDLFWWANISYVDGVLMIRGKSYDPKPYGNLTDIHVWIENEQSEVIFEDWRYDMPTYYEGEWVTGERAVNGRGGALYYMPEDFEKEIIWTSNGEFTGPDDVKEAFDKGSGFAFFSGHGSPGTWEDQTPGIPGNRQYASVTGLEVSNLFPFPPFIRELPIWPMDDLENTNKLPITVVGGCHNSLFNVSLIPSIMHIFWLIYGGVNTGMWTHGQPVPDCWSWYLVKMPETGSIATIGNTGLGWGWEGEFCTLGAGDGWISSEFFRQYGDNGYEYLGQLYSQTQTSYVGTFKEFTLPECWWYPDFGWDAIDQQAIEQWVLLGDPSLKIGGYE
jgi:hypothetical protein